MKARAGRWAGGLAMPPGRVVARSLLGMLAVLALLAGTPATVVRADEHAVAITDTGFEPDTLTVFVGEPVTWTNTTASEHSVFIAVGVLDSGPITPGESFTNVFQAAGTVAYHDGTDPQVLGTIIVNAAPGGSPVPAPAPGAVAPTQSGGNGAALFLAVAVVGAIAVMATIAGLIGASRRPGR